MVKNFPIITMLLQFLLLMGHLLAPLLAVDKIKSEAGSTGGSLVEEHRVRRARKLRWYKKEGRRVGGWRLNTPIRTKKI